MSVKTKLLPLLTWRSAIVTSSLPPSARLVALALSLHMSERGDSCFPAIATLADETGLSPRQVRRLLQQLEAEGFLAVHRTTDGRGTNRYEAIVPPGDGDTPPLSPMTPPPVTGDTPPLSPMTPPPVTGDTQDKEAITSLIPRGNGLHYSALPPTAVARQRERPKPRPRNVLIDTLAEVEGSDPRQLTRAHARALAVAIAEIRRASPDVDPDEIRRRAEIYRARWPEWTLTGPALAKHWAGCAQDVAPRGPAGRQL